MDLRKRAEKRMSTIFEPNRALASEVNLRILLMHTNALIKGTRAVTELRPPWGNVPEISIFVENKNARSRPWAFQTIIS